MKRERAVTPIAYPAGGFVVNRLADGSPSVRLAHCSEQKVSVSSDAVTKESS